MKDSASVAAADRRGARRVPGPFDGSYRGHSGRRSVRISDLSATGCFIETMEPLAAGARVQLHIELPGAGPVDVAGDVQYTSARLGFGVRFVDVPDDARRMLEAAVDSQTAEA
jgi:hypothetical protein